MTKPEISEVKKIDSKLADLSVVKVGDTRGSRLKPIRRKIYTV